MIENDMRPAVIQWLNKAGYSDVHETSICSGWCDVIGAKWDVRFGRARPNLIEFVCVELKMRDIKGVISQAYENHYECNLSYCAMPADFIERMRPQSRQKFINAGVGLLAVQGDKIRIEIQSNYNNKIPLKLFKDRFWAFKLRHSRRPEK